MRAVFTRIKQSKYKIHKNNNKTNKPTNNNNNNNNSNNNNNNNKVNMGRGVSENVCMLYLGLH